MKLFVIFIYLYCAGSLAHSICFDPDKSGAQLYQYAEYAHAGKKSRSLDELLRNNTLKFIPLASENQNLGFTSDYYWLRFSLRNSSIHEKTYYLETARPITDRATLYQLTADNRERFESGDQIAFNERQLPHRSTVFKVKLPPGTSSTFYIELKSDGETINLPLRLYSEDDFWIHNYNQQLFLGIFYGLLLLAGIVYLFFYSSLSERAFLYYGFYVFSIILFQATLDGLFFQYILPSGGFLNDKAVLLTALLCNFFLLKYCEHFLKIQSNMPGYYTCFRGIYIFIGLLAAGTLLSPVSMQWVYPLSNVNGLLSLLLILLVVVTKRYRQHAVDPCFAVGISFLVCGLLGFVLNNLGALPNNFFTLNSAKFGIGMEVIFLSLSMTNLIRNLRLEKERSQMLALKKSEEISELKSYFMSNMSHELRTPLNLIMGVANEQLSVDADADTRENFELIRSASVSLMSNINDILDFETIEKNELRLRTSVFNPANAIRGISNSWKVQAREKGLDYEFEIDPDIPMRIRADQQRLLQVLNNLLSNAVKFTHTGRVRFKVKGIPRAGNQFMLHMEVADTGVGMDATYKQGAFDSFCQMRRNDKRNFGGIGLGLSIVRHLVELFGGEIQLESTPGNGTVVYLDIPVQAYTGAGPTSPLEKKVESGQGSLRVLIAEDNKMNQLVLKKILDRAGNFTYEMASNGKEALERLKSQPFDVVLMDLQMPVMDGYEATAVIRGGGVGDAYAELPIIAVTADTTDATRRRVEEVGMNAYLTKPLVAETLLEQLQLATTSLRNVV